MLYKYIKELMQHTKNSIDWINNEVTGEVTRSLVAYIPELVDIFLNH
jgi:hypothetical protein